jgi:hypothetical protein
MLGANQFGDVIEMVEDVFDCRGLIAFHKHAHAGDAHHAAGLSDFLNRFVGF